jgi:hypothetical protein
MEFFLGAEAEAPAATILSKFNQVVKQGLRKLSDTTYGEELSSIAIVTILLRADKYEDGFAERMLFQRKQKSADIRLRIDFELFMRSTPVERYDIYREHILSSIETLRRKVSGQFDFDALVEDVTSILSSPEIRDQCITIRRFY